MDFYQAVETRQSCRAYADRPVEREAVLRILRAARLSPSACNSQPWTFVVADDQARCAKVSDCLQSGRLGINRWTGQVPCFIVLVSEKKERTGRAAEILQAHDFTQVDAGIAVQTLALAAAAEGLGSCIVGWIDRPALRQVLDIPEGKEVPVILALGYPADPAVLPKKSREEADLFRFGSYSAGEGR